MILKLRFLILAYSMALVSTDAFALNHCTVALNSLKETVQQGEFDQKTFRHQIAQALIMETPLFEKSEFISAFKKAMSKFTSTTGHKDLIHIFKNSGSDVTRKMAIQLWEDLKSPWTYLSRDPTHASIADIKNIESAREKYKMHNAEEVRNLYSIINLIDSDKMAYDAMLDILTAAVSQSKSFSFKQVGYREKLLKASDNYVSASDAAIQSLQASYKVNFSEKTNLFLSSPLSNTDLQKSQLVDLLTNEYPVLFAMPYILAFDGALKAQNTDVDDFLKHHDQLSPQMREAFAENVLKYLKTSYRADKWNDVSGNVSQELLEEMQAKNLGRYSELSKEEFLNASFLLYRLSQNRDLELLAIQAISHRLKISAKATKKYQSVSTIYDTSAKDLGTIALAASWAAGAGVSHFIGLHGHETAAVVTGIGTFFSPILSMSATYKGLADFQNKYKIPKFIKYLKENRSKFTATDDSPPEGE